MSTTPLLSTSSLEVGYGHTALLHSLDLRLERGTLTVLLGANGAGKSTLLKALTGAAKPMSGTVTVNGKPIEQLSRHELSRTISIVGTERVMAGALTVSELVSLGRQPYTGFLGRLDSNDKLIVEQSIEQVGIAHKAQNFISQLSDGERQKVMIAKALAQNTPIIILDEPTAFLDTASRIATMTLLHSLAHRQQKAILLSSHDISQALLLADEIWAITAQRQVTSGTTEQVLMSGTMEKLFDGSTIEFSHELCDFQPVMQARKHVRLVCHDHKLRRCVHRALMRYGIGTDQQAQHTIEARSETSFILDGTLHATTVAQIAKAINETENQR